MNIDKREDTQDDIGKLRARESMEAVSYTHLDVYKRQPDFYDQL